MVIKYVGQFKDGYQEGQGTSTWSDGDKYVGGYSRMGKRMVKEYKLGLMEVLVMQGNGRVIKN